MATSGENYWPPTGRTSWPLTLARVENRRVGPMRDDIQVRLVPAVEQLMGVMGGTE